MTENVAVVAVCISSEKGIPKTPVDSVRVGAVGIEGDIHAGTPGRNVSLLDRGAVERFSSETGLDDPGCGAFGENITVRIDGDPRLSVGDEIEIGEVRLIVTETGKECHGEGCSIFRQTGRCVMPTHGVFCSVLSCGDLSAGMTGRIVRSGRVP